MSELLNEFFSRKEENYASQYGRRKQSSFKYEIKSVECSLEAKFFSFMLEYINVKDKSIENVLQSVRLKVTSFSFR